MEPPRNLLQLISCIYAKFRLKDKELMALGEITFHFSRIKFFNSQIVINSIIHFIFCPICLGPDF